MAGKKGKSGRKPRSNLAEETRKKLIEAGTVAAAYIRDVISDTEINPNALRLDAAKYAVNQAIGLPKYRVEAEIEHQQELLIMVKWEGNKVEQIEQSASEEAAQLDSQASLNDV